MTKRVSIIILNYNGERFIKKLLESIYKQTFRDFEIVFVDNASTDNSIRILCDTLRRVPFKEVKTILNEQNLGYCRGNNVGLKHARGEYIVFLNNDTFVSQEWLENLVKALDRHPMIGACQSKILSATTGKVETVGNLLDIYARASPSSNQIKGVDILIDSFFYPGGASVVVRREVLNKCGGFDEQLFYGDYDLGWRIRLYDYKIATAPESICYHFGSYTVKSLFSLFKQVYYRYRERIYVTIKNYSMSRAIVRVPLSLILIFLESVGLSLKFRKPCIVMPIKAALWNIGNLKKTMKKRAEVKRKRVVSDDEIEKYLVSYSTFIELIKGIIGGRT